MDTLKFLFLTSAMTLAGCETIEMFAEALVQDPGAFERARQEGAARGAAAANADSSYQYNSNALSQGAYGGTSSGQCRPEKQGALTRSGCYISARCKALQEAGQYDFCCATTPVTCGTPSNQDSEASR